MRTLTIACLILFQLSTPSAKPSLTYGAPANGGDSGRVQSLWTPSQKLQFRAELEKGYQEFYGRLYPGANAQVFMRDDEFVLLIQRGKMSPIVFVIDGSDADNPKQRLVGIIMKPKRIGK